MFVLVEQFSLLLSNVNLFFFCFPFTDKTYVNKYDFALNSSLYKLVDSQMLGHDEANATCAKLLDNTGHLAQFETLAELEAVSREVPPHW